MKRQIKINNVTIGNDKSLVLIAGPCVIEDNLSVVFDTAQSLKTITDRLGIPFIFKASYDKANRTSIDSYRGPGIDKGIKVLQKIKEKYNIPILTDIHEINQIEQAAQVADIIQIPAFLSRQTDIIVAAAKSGKVVNIKKGQFLSPQQVIKSAQKSVASGNDKVIITERGFSFGYGNLVSDMRVIPIIQSFGYPVVFDATHSVQLPGAGGDYTAGERQFVKTLSLSACAAGADALFLEVHPNPDKAPCDGPNMLPIEELESLLKKCAQIFNTVREI
ncbi:MAG: 3-deoxy-8-phosphooctulonate synthase [Cyanobacteriota bacterium]